MINLDFDWTILFLRTIFEMLWALDGGGIAVSSLQYCISPKEFKKCQVDTLLGML